jgi:hypothetical protein
MAHNYRTESRPRWEMSFLAQAQVAEWRAGRAEHKRADGQFSASGRIAAWSAGRVERERAGFRFGADGGLVRGAPYARAGRGLFSYSGRISVVNSNFS